MFFYQKVFFHIHNIWNNLYGFHEFYRSVSSNFLLQKMIYHKIYICNLCSLHELLKYVSSNCVQEKIIYYMNHICDLCGFHELCKCVTSNSLTEKQVGLYFKKCLEDVRACQEVHLRAIMIEQSNETTFSQPLNDFKSDVLTQLYLYTIIW